MTAAPGDSRRQFGAQTLFGALAPREELIPAGERRSFCCQSVKAPQKLIIQHFSPRTGAHRHAGARWSALTVQGGDGRLCADAQDRWGLLGGGDRS